MFLRMVWANGFQTRFEGRFVLLRLRSRIANGLLSVAADSPPRTRLTSELNRVAHIGPKNFELTQDRAVKFRVDGPSVNPELMSKASRV